MSVRMYPTTTAVRPTEANIATVSAGAAFAALATTITMSASNPGSVVAGMLVFDNSIGSYIGVVLSWTGTALTLAGVNGVSGATSASAGSADVLTFQALPNLGIPSNVAPPYQRFYKGAMGTAVDVAGDMTGDAGALSNAGYVALFPSGPTSARSARPGVIFGDTTLGVVIFFDGINWRNAITGAVV